LNLNLVRLSDGSRGRQRDDKKAHSLALAATLGLTTL
jgi:hypothetical protein